MVRIKKKLKQASNYFIKDALRLIWLRWFELDHVSFQSKKNSKYYCVLTRPVYVPSREHALANQIAQIW
jgi:hypothetical protein